MTQPCFVQSRRPIEPVIDAPVIARPDPPVVAMPGAAATRACLSCGDESATGDFCASCSDRSRQALLSVWDDLGEGD